jgi:hypothetical protein
MYSGIECKNLQEFLWENSKKFPSSRKPVRYTPLDLLAGHISLRNSKGVFGGNLEKHGPWCWEIWLNFTLFWASGVAQVVKLLPSKCEPQTSNPGTAKKEKEKKIRLLIQFPTSVWPQIPFRIGPLSPVSSDIFSQILNTATITVKLVKNYSPRKDTLPLQVMTQEA